jgi:hypothetical protein
MLCKDSEVDPILNSIHNPTIRTRIQKRGNPDLVKIWSRFLGKSNTAKPWGRVLGQRAMDNAAGWGMALLVQASSEQLHYRVDCPVSRVSQIKGARLRRVKGAGVGLSGGWCWAKMVTVGCSMQGKEVGYGKERKERGRVGQKERIVPWMT